MKDCKTCKYLNTSVWTYPCINCSDSGNLYIQNNFEIDPIIESVRRKLLNRSQVGLIKYGVGLDRPDLTKLQWLIHLQEELLDACGYLETLIQKEQRNG